MSNNTYRSQRSQRQGGYALITALILFLSATTLAIIGLSNAVFREIKTIKNESNSKQSYYASESLLEDAMYRIKEGKQIDALESLSVGSALASSTISVASDGTRLVTSEGTMSGAVRLLEASLNTTSGASFTYALQAGAGGLDLDNGHVVGDIYTTGSIRGCGTCTISGAAIAAGKSYSSLAEENALPSSPPNNITFGNTSATRGIAQSFTVSQDLSLTGLELYIRKNGSPSNVIIRIVEDSYGNPSASVIASVTLLSSSISSSYSWLTVTPSSNPVLEAGTTYWLVIDPESFSASSYYVIGGNTDTYSSGVTKTGRYGVIWNTTSPPNLDTYFKVFIGANENGITGADVSNKLTAGSAYAYNVKYVNSEGVIYCQVGEGNNKSCDNSRGDPVVEESPLSLSEITSWKAQAQAGGIEGDNVTVGHLGGTLGPRKIEGNLTVNSGGTLYVSGPLWVVGDVVINGGATVSPSESDKSYAIIADGTVTLSGSAEITGNSESHILLLSTSLVDPAITISGGANDTVLSAPYGGILVSGGASARAAFAKHVRVSGGATITYDPSLSSLDLTSGGSSAFQIKSWKETE